MARKSGFNQELAKYIVELAAQGYCVKDVAYFVGVSDRTILRWRDVNPDFNKAFLETTQRSWENIEAIKRFGRRTHTRPAYISPNYGQNPLKKPLNRSQGQSFLDTSNKQQRTWMGLPIMSRPKPAVITSPYVNQNNHWIEWITKECYGLTLHQCSMAIWEQKHNPTSAYDSDEFISIMV